MCRINLVDFTLRCYGCPDFLEFEIKLNESSAGKLKNLLLKFQKLQSLEIIFEFISLS